MDFDLRQLEIFCAVVEHESFSRAGRAVKLAQASVSERIANLERDVGARLLDRLGRRAVPTQVGQLLYERARELLQRRDAVVSELGELLGRRRGTVRVTASTIPGEYILPPLLAAFRKIEPDVLVEVRIADSASAIAEVANGRSDLGFAGRLEEQGAKMTYSELWHDELVLVVAPDHGWARHPPRLDADALDGADFVERRGGSGTQHAALSLLRELTDGRSPNHDVVARLDSPTAIKEAVVAGVGAAVLSARSVQRELRDGALVRIELPVASPRRAFYLVTDPRRTMSPIGEIFTQFIREHAERAES